jgi:hypothetical protein
MFIGVSRGAWLGGMEGLSSPDAGARGGLWPLGKGREPASNKEQLTQGGLRGR